VIIQLQDHHQQIEAKMQQCSLKQFKSWKISGRRQKISLQAHQDRSLQQLEASRQDSGYHAAATAEQQQQMQEFLQQLEEQVAAHELQLHQSEGMLEAQQAAAGASPKRRCQVNSRCQLLPRPKLERPELDVPNKLTASSTRLEDITQQLRNQDAAALALAAKVDGFEKGDT